MTLRVGDLIDLDEVAGDLVAAGYERVDQVEDRGQFAMRGGILDVYPATEDRAIRVDLFDIEIESLRWFSTFTQRSLGDTDAVEIAPSAELAAEHREVAEIAALEDERPDIAELLPVDRFRAFLDLAADADVLIAAEEEVEPALRDHWQDVCAAFHDDDARHLYVHPDAVRAGIGGARALRAVGAVLRPARPAPRPGRGGDVALAEGGRVRAREAAALGLPHRDRLAAARRGRPRPVQPHPPEGRLDRRGDRREDLRFAQANLRDGFIAAGLKLAVIPEHRLFRRRRAERSDDRPRRGALRSFTDLRTGDFVVHEDHGVARFAGFETKTVAGVTRDYLELEFQGTDKVFMPTEQLAKISRYVGAGGGAPTLSKLGGSRWDTLKARARRAAQELAGELLNLYAERKRRSGHAFEPDGDWQREFEEAFPYTETPDQRDAIDVVKEDMEAPAADGPARLRRRRLRQDRGRAAGGVQGGGRRPSGPHARPDDDPRPAARGHVRRAPARTTPSRSSRSAASAPPRSRRRRSPGSRRARSTSSSARTAC